MALGLGGTFFWQPGQADDMGLTDWGRMLQEQNPDASYYRLGASLGITPGSGFDRWFRQQFPEFNLGYKAYTASNPLTANIVDYGNSLGNYDDWFRQYMRAAPQVRGEDPSSRGGGPARWVGR